jgi:hypothetical protein
LEQFCNDHTTMPRGKPCWSPMPFSQMQGHQFNSYRYVQISLINNRHFIIEKNIMNLLPSVNIHVLPEDM